METKSDFFRILIAAPKDDPVNGLARTCREREWEATRVFTPQAALEALGDKTPCAYHLFIADTRLEDFDAVRTFIRARRASPLTRRLLIIEEIPADTAAGLLIKAVNEARIDVLLPAGVSDEELARKVFTCLETASQAQKQIRLEQITSYQNKQMFGIAQRLKKKSSALNDRILDLKKERARINTKLHAAFQQKKDPSDFAGRMDAYGMPVTARALSRQFTQLARWTELFFQQIVVDADIEPLNICLGKILSSDGQEAASPGFDPALEGLKNRIMRTLYASPEKHASPEKADRFSLSSGQAEPAVKRELPDLVTISISSDRVKALISLNACTNEERKTISLSGILDLLRLKEIQFGIVGDSAIEFWIESAQAGDEPFEIAVGNPPVQGQDGKVTYLFETNNTNPGKLMDNGRIDFKDRGPIPFVHKDDLIARKTAVKPGENGISISGDTVTVNEPLDPVFLAGSGARLSDNGLGIYADVDGHPHLDPLGEISVSPELNIDGDIGFKTGNIDFKGHIIISGRVREGFFVKGVSLTAKEVEGATVELSGDLCVSGGIKDTTVASVGSIYAKFINNSTAKAFGNIVVQKEIIDSELLVSGICQNPGGSVMGSKISARNGVEAGRIGTPASEPSQIRTGLNDHTRFWEQKLDAELTSSMEYMQKIKTKIESMEEQDQGTYARITQEARKQETIVADLEAVQTRIAEHRLINDQTAVSLALSELKALLFQKKEVDRSLNQCFDSHDKNLKSIEKNKKKLAAIKSRNKTIMLKKKGLKEFDRRTGRKACVLVQKGITQGTVIISPHASLSLKADRGRCKIQELSVGDEKDRHFELTISDA